MSDEINLDTAYLQLQLRVAQADQEQAREILKSLYAEYLEVENQGKIDYAKAVGMPLELLKIDGVRLAQQLRIRNFSAEIEEVRLPALKALIFEFYEKKAKTAASFRRIVEEAEMHGDDFNGFN